MYRNDLQAYLYSHICTAAYVPSFIQAKVKPLKHMCFSVLLVLDSISFAVPYIEC